MSKYPGIPVDRSGSNEFFSDANLNLRAREATYADFAPLPGERVEDAVAGSGALQAHLRHGGQATPLQLADIEVDDGGRGAEGFGYDAHDLNDVNPRPAPSPAAMPDDSSLDRLADLLMARLEKKLLGGQ